MEWKLAQESKLEETNKLLFINIFAMNGELKEVKVRESKFNEKINDLQKEIEGLKVVNKAAEDSFNLADLISLFRFYFIDPNIKSLDPDMSWADLTKLMASAAFDLEEGLIDAADFERKKVSWNKLSSVAGVDVYQLSELARERNSQAHADIRSAAKQQEFIKKLRGETFADPIADGVRALLLGAFDDSVKLRRKI
jgi:hypothetical protein